LRAAAYNSGFRRLIFDSLARLKLGLTLEPGLAARLGSNLVALVGKKRGRIREYVSLRPRKR
jgi:hypothetical protein